MRTVGKIDIEVYKCIADNISTDEVIITDERVQHIKERHPGHYEHIEMFLQAAVEHPDYILEDAENTGLVLKLVEEQNMRMQIVIRVHTSTDAAGFKNSIISAWKISESRWNNYLRNKKTLYKSE